MELAKIIKYLDKKYNPRIAAKWDNPGFQVFNDNEIDIARDIKKVIVCLDITNEVIEQAKNDNTDLIITRHPFIFNDLKEEKKVKKEQIKELTKLNVYVYSIHTNYDCSPNQTLLDILKANFGVVKDKRFGSDNEGYEIKLKKEMDPEDFISTVNKCFDTDICQINTNFNMTRPISKFYIVTGSAGSTMLEEKMNDSVFITGEMKWNEMVYANDNFMSIILKGHYMENYFIDDISNKLENSFKELDVNKFDIGNQLKDYK